MSLPSLAEHFHDRLGRSGLLDQISQKLARSKKTGPPPVVELLGPEGSDLTFVAASVAKARKAPLLIVSPGREPSEHRYDDLFFFGSSDVFHYAAWDLLPFEQDKPGLEAMSKRMDALARLAGLTAQHAGAGAPQPPMISAPVEALLQKTFPAEWLRSKSLVVEWGQTIDRGALDRRLNGLGYAEAPMVESRGEYSMRGGIVDIFPLDADHPYRLDLFGDEIESIRRFDVGTQRSLESDRGESSNIERIVLLPANEKTALDWAIKEGVALVSPLDYLPADTVVVLDAPELQHGATAKFDELVAKELSRIKAKKAVWVDPSGKERPLPDPSQFYLTGDELRAAFRERESVVEAPRLPFPPDAADKRDRRRVEAKSRSFHDVKPELDAYLEAIHARQREDYLVVIVCDNAGQAHRLKEILAEREIAAGMIGPDGVKPRGPMEGFADVALAVGDLTAGFIMPEARLMLVTDREIFGRYKRRHVYRKIYKGTPVRSATEIGRNDFVVHVEHGVGKYVGMRRQAIDGADVDLIEILYKDDDRLLVPVEKVHYVQKFVAGEHVEPTLDKLGGAKWKKRKQKSEAQVEEMARQLLELYAARELAEGHAFATDNHLVREFESSFLYKETPDQIEAIHQAKMDMESPKPMDRLICGDVGYGKTEVAIRAAFKAIQDGKQVAFLCPTTVLASQHYNTFRERFADYPVQVEQLSRFQSAKEVADSIKRIASGEARMAIGTHRLLSKDVRFSDLGLVIVDEEQRFGVAHKERFKELRASVDVMTLSATPIPRTLYMALAGIRDMSVITTAPADRYPIRTRVIHFERDQIEEAVLRELNRGGQVYFIHNRVHNIDEVADRLREIAPKAKILIAHGQMSDDDLEDVMTKFVEGEADILVATTIVENGLDIPNCNTIVINRADAFGLAQLYQLRGRVGRGNRQAYAYLIVPEGQPITEAAVKRLQAIEEFTELGVGFQVAMRDMEIRGTGNVLGKEQSGAMEAIGFELYCEMLEAAVKRARGDDSPRPTEIDVSWRVPSYIPPDFMPVESQRFDLYKRLATARATEQIDEVEEEIRDRFGKIPDPVSNIFNISRLRVLASQAGATRLALAPDGFKVEHAGDEVKAMAVWIYLREIHPGIKDANFVTGNAITVSVNDWHRGNRLNKAVKLFKAFINNIEKALGGADTTSLGGAPRGRGKSKRDEEEEERRAQRPAAARMPRPTPQPPSKAFGKR
jgi:transcription-repair coupling factor (superfamily II helicase)